jgi:glycosyltransferase involved in cell wall biosynthesis
VSRSSSIAAPRQNLLSVVIGTRNRVSELRPCLDSLQAALLPADWAVEVIIVDNGSDDNTCELVNNFARSSDNPAFRYLYEPRQGKSYAVNTGFATARGSIIAFADDDVVVERSWLASIVDEFRREQELGILTGRVESLDESGVRVAVTRATEEKTLDCKDSLDGLILGCNLAVRREVFAKVSGRDTRLGPGRGLSCEDIDFAYRVLRAGFRGRFSPRPVVYHSPGLRNRSTEYLRGWGAFYLKYLLQGDTLIVRKAWWEVRRILRDLRTSPGSSSLNELWQMLIGALIMAQRISLSLLHRDPAKAPAI